MIDYLAFSPESCNPVICRFSCGKYVDLFPGLRFPATDSAYWARFRCSELLFLAFLLHSSANRMSRKLKNGDAGRAFGIRTPEQLFAKVKNKKLRDLISVIITGTAHDTNAWIDHEVEGCSFSASSGGGSYG